jgi:hypothetical protein
MQAQLREHLRHLVLGECTSGETPDRELGRRARADTEPRRGAANAFVLVGRDSCSGRSDRGVPYEHAEQSATTATNQISPKAGQA